MRPVRQRNAAPRLLLLGVPTAASRGSLWCADAAVAQHLRGCALLDDLAVVEEDDPVGHLPREADLVGHHDGRRAVACQAADDVEHLADELGVERARRLVEEQDLRRARVHGRWRRAAAGRPRLARVLVGLVGEADPAEQGLGQLALLPGLPLQRHRRLDDVLDRGEVREQVEVLEHQSDLGATSQDLRLAGSLQPVAPALVADVLPVDRDRPAIDGLEVVDRAKQRRLARPRRADQHDDLAGLDGEGHVAQHRVPPYDFVTSAISTRPTLDATRGDVLLVEGRGEALELMRHLRCDRWRMPRRSPVRWRTALPARHPLPARRPVVATVRPPNGGPAAGGRRRAAHRASGEPALDVVLRDPEHRRDDRVPDHGDEQHRDHALVAVVDDLHGVEQLGQRDDEHDGRALHQPDDLVERVRHDRPRRLRQGDRKKRMRRGSPSVAAASSLSLVDREDPGADDLRRVRRLVQRQSDRGGGERAEQGRRRELDQPEVGRERVPSPSVG